MGNIKIVKRQEREKQLLLDNLKRMPIIEAACSKSGISRATFYRWKQDDLEFAKAAEKAQEEGDALIGDVAVSKVIKGINEDNLSAAMYWLNHRDSRFSNKVEITTNSKIQEALTPEQQEAVNKALVLTGLAEKDSEKKS